MRDGGTPLPNERRLSGRVALMAIAQPATRPANPRFSSGPCAKPPTWKLDDLSDASLGRSHRAVVGKSKLKEAIELTREILHVPHDYKIGIVPASDTGAFEMAMSLQTGGLAFGEISTRSRPASSAMTRARSGETTPTFSPSAPMRRISVARIRSLMRGPVSRCGGALWGLRAMVFVLLAIGVVRPN